MITNTLLKICNFRMKEMFSSGCNTVYWKYIPAYQSIWHHIPEDWKSSSALLWECQILHSTSVGSLLCVASAYSSAFKSRKPSCWDSTCIPVYTATYPRRRYLRQDFCHFQITHIEPLWRDCVASADLKAFKNDCEVVKTEIMLIMC
jgi:hypothetical protein